MGRHLKKGLDYFNIDCVQEDSLNYLEAKHGISGYGVLVKLWRKIYMIEGYYCDWSEKNIYLFAKEVGLEVDQVKTIVEMCFSEGIFHEEMYKKYGVLTSHGVQRRWMKIVSDAKRKDCQIDENLLITGKTLDEKRFTPEEMTKTLDQSTQMKEEESKEDKSKALLAPAVPAESKIIKRFVAPERNQVRDFYLSTMGNTQSPGSWPADKCRMEADTCFDHYTANGWVQGRGKPIKDWQAACRNFIRNELKGTFSPKSETKAQKNSIPVQKIDTDIPKIAKDLNYLYGQFLENPDHVTIISVDPAQYDYLKSAGRLAFSAEAVDEIMKVAVRTINEKNPPFDDAKLKTYMKKLGVIEFFNHLKSSGKEVVFDAQN